MESRRAGVYRQKVGELEFTDRKQKNQSLQIESRRIRVYKQNVGELELTEKQEKSSKKCASRFCKGTKSEYNQLKKIWAES